MRAEVGALGAEAVSRRGLAVSARGHRSRRTLVRLCGHSRFLRRFYSVLCVPRPRLPFSLVLSRRRMRFHCGLF